MVERHLPLRAPGLTRALGVLVLLAGILTMHTAVFAMPAHGHAQGHSAPAHGGSAPTMPGNGPVAMVAVPAPRSTTPDHTAAGAHGTSGPDCGGPGCSGTHGAMHGCVFILAAIALLLALVVLYRLALDRSGNAVTPPRHRRPRRERAPPWTVLSLAELSILRI
ncbi:hypothetical protein F5X71_30820 [Nocardia brasiliensis]|uniref:Uncharacterized protein n=1 Tax=Nocardia brasiliensis TaxID=37326 RepID=A0A6G9XZ44_NOCBR|nr:DUF6153 family protein [Nocardia brasiliensis]QIS06117.1 hypothetical protein F5X71_30820 [Nocardia brasiliensis]